MRLGPTDEQERQFGPFAFLFGAAVLGLSGGEFVYWISTGVYLRSALGTGGFPLAFFVLVEVWVAAAAAIRSFVRPSHSTW